MTMPDSSIAPTLSPKTSAKDVIAGLTSPPDDTHTHKVPSKDAITPPPPPAPLLTIPEFAAKIKERSPDLAATPDDELVRKVFEHRPDLMQYVQTMEPRAEHETKTSPPPAGFFGRFAEGIGIPTSLDELKTMMEGQVKALAESAQSPAVSTLGPSGIAGKAVTDIGINYGKGVREQAVKSFQEMHDAWRNIQEGGPRLTNLGKMGAAFSDLALKGILSPVGGKSVATGGEDWRDKRYGAFAGDVSAATLLSILALDSVKGPKSATSTGAKAVRETERLASLSGPTSGRLDSFTVAWLTKPLLKQSLQEIGLTDEEMGASAPWKRGEITTPGGEKIPKTAFPGRSGQPVTQLSSVSGEPIQVSNLRAGARRVLDVVDHAVDIANRPFEQIVSEYGDEVIEPSVKQRIAGQLREKAAEYRSTNDTALADSLDAQAKLVEDASNIRSLNDLKIRANKNWQTFKTPGQLNAATVQSGIAWKLTGDTIREFMYPELEKLSGLDLSQFGRREAAAMQYRDGVYKTYFTKIDPEQAGAAARGYLGSMEESSPYRLHILKRALRVLRTPAGEFNVQFRKGIGKLGEGMLPEEVRTVGKPQRLLTGSTTPTKFRITTGLPEEVLSGQSVTSPEMHYAGQQEVPVTPEPETEFEIRGGRAAETGVDLEALKINIQNLKHKLSEGIGDRFQTLQQLQEAEGKLAEMEGTVKPPPTTAGTAEGAANDTALFKQAREELGPTARVGEIAQRAQELKDAQTQARGQAAGKTEGVPSAKSRAATSTQRESSLGSQRAAVPTEATTGKLTPPGERVRQIGPQAAAVPDRSITGPQTKKVSRWQYVTASKEPTEEVAIEGPGVLETTDPKMAANTLQRLVDFAQTSEFRKLPFETRERIKGTILDLDGQLKDYAAYRLRQRPRSIEVKPMRPGTIPRTKQRALAAVTAYRASQKRRETESEGAEQGAGR